jgi:His/Glu/Gln/Arg/opine family amino acid ABC transporter permease subunit
MEQLSPRARGRTPGAGTEISAVNPLISAAAPVAFLLALALWLAADVKWSFVQDLDFSVIYQYRIALLQGLLNTVLITFSSLLLGLVLGFVFACLGYAPVAPVRWLIAAYIEVLRDVPLIVALFWIHFALPVVTGISTTVFESSFIAMALQSSAYTDRPVGRRGCAGSLPIEKVARRGPAAGLQNYYPTASQYRTRLLQGELGSCAALGRRAHDRGDPDQQLYIQANRDLHGRCHHLSRSRLPAERADFPA